MRYIIGIFILFATFKSLSAKRTESTLNVFEQVEDLKQKIRNKIFLSRPPRHHHYKIHKDPLERDNSLEYQEYVDEHFSSHLQPILESEANKDESNALLRQLKTTPAQARKDPRGQHPVLRSEIGNWTDSEGPTSEVLPMMRRNYFSKFEELRDQELYWVQMQVLITPFLTGRYTYPRHNQQQFSFVTTRDHTFLRFMQLLHTNTTGQEIDDVRTILVQISNLKLEMFLWSPDAIKMLLNELIIGSDHTFIELKKGIKRLFAIWHLDTSATDIILKESRMFRPPCIIWRPSGSTKQPTRKTITPLPPLTTRTCNPNDASCEEQYREGLREKEMGPTEVTEALPDATDVRGPTEPTEPEEEEETTPTVLREDDGGDDGVQRSEKTVIEWVHQERTSNKHKGRKGKKSKRQRHRNWK